MSLGTFNRCCLCMELRIGSFIIAYLLLISRSIHLVLSCFQLSGINTHLSGYTSHSHMLMYQDLAFFKLIVSFEILLLTFELLITAALINGLHRKIQDQVQMFYVGGFVFEVLRLILVAVILMRYAHLMLKMYGIWEWITLSLEMMGHLLYLYFLSVIRSYYFLMRKEETAKRWNVYSDSLVQLKFSK